MEALQQVVNEHDLIRAFVLSALFGAFIIVINIILYE